MHDAQRGQGGVIVLAGRTPYTVDGRAPGSRDRAIQWYQDQLDQSGIVRGYVKWYHELARTDTSASSSPVARRLLLRTRADRVHDARS